MSQVRNLRAMFEGKGEDSSHTSTNASPGPTGGERRGRSPAGTTTPTPGANAAEAPRPLSKVRTNFVAIEKDGRIGLQRNPSSDSNLSRTLSVNEYSRTGSTSREPRSRTPRKMFGSPPITESSADPFDAAAVTDKPSTNPDKHVDVEESVPGLLPAEPKPASSNTTNGKPLGSSQAAAAGKPASKPSTTTTKAAAAKPTTKPSAPKLSTARRTEASKGSASGVPTTGARASRPSDILTRPTASSLSKKHEPLKTSQSATGFVKPKPKSPTKPVHLPSTLTAPTASSSSKGARASLTPSASAGSLGGRPSSHTVSSAAPATTRPVKRQSATATAARGRASIGPPPAKKSEPTERRRESHVDEGFLARMMRPTQSSSSKTSDKAPAETTPPRKAATRPLSGAHPPATKAASTISSQRSTQSRSPAQRARSQLSNEPEKESSTPEPTTVSNVAVSSVEVELPRETEPIVEEPALASDEPTQPESVAQVIPEAIPEAEPTDEILEETANVETAEEAIDIAQEVDLVQTLVEPEPQAEPVSEPVAHDGLTKHEDDPEPLVEEARAEEAPIDEVEVEEQAHDEAAHKEAVEAQEAPAAETEAAEMGTEDDKEADFTQKLTPAAEEAIVSPNEEASAELDKQTVPEAARTTERHESVDSSAADDLADLMAKSGLEPPAESTKTAAEEV